MVSNEKRWKILFFFSLGLAIGSAFCMKWMESDLWANGQKFSILGLELFYDKAKMEMTLSGLGPQVKTVLSYHLHFDFAFMAGIFPCIGALCMLAVYRTRKSGVRKLLKVLAILQLAAWGLDIFENTQLLSWMKNPVIDENSLNIFHLAVTVKWLISIVAVIIAVPFLFNKPRL